ncbi:MULTISPECIES: DUF6033 family protein [unclassified Clostridium]|uniref:DUF6033 family protein n=1 Tax=unclassified Clostridium TaxID=2614128 RepID=UPI0025BFA13C|nr:MULTISPECIES: DUF6033 family protein [unclassified Clostridium]
MSLSALNNWNYKLFNTLQNQSLQENIAMRENNNHNNFNDIMLRIESSSIDHSLMKKYGLSVAIQSVPKNEEEMERLIRNGNLSDITIAPNIIEKMKTNSKIKANVEKSIELYLNREIPSLKSLESLGVTVLTSGVIIHEDGTTTVWSASETSQEEKEKGKKIQEEKQKEREAERLRLEATYKGKYSTNILLQSMLSMDTHINFSLDESFVNSLPALELKVRRTIL